MDAKAHANPYRDFCELPELFIKNGSVLPELSDRIDKMVDNMILELTEVLGATTCNGEYSVYTGYLGIVMLFIKVAVRKHDKVLMNLALKKSEMAFKNMKNKRACFLNGDAGPMALCAIINYLYEDEKSAQIYAKKLVNLSQDVIEDTSMPDEILYGRAGYLYGLLLVNKFLGDEVVDPKIIRNVAEKILQSGKCRSKCRKSCVPLEYEWHDKNYLGAAHGVAGILYMLLLSAKVLTRFELDELIKPTVDWLLKHHRFKSGNFASSEGSDRDRLVQWCHGAPGFVHMLLMAYEVYEDERYLKAALDCGDVIWQRGLVSKGYSLCHGVSGNSYAFLQLYKVTKDIKHWHRAACFADWCTKYPRNQGLQPDRPFSLYEGKAGMIYFLLDFKEPLESSFPGFDL